MSKNQTQNSNVSSPWAPYEPSGDAPWNLKRVVHLHRRAAFAASWAELQRDLEDGPQAAVDRLLKDHGEKVGLNGFEDMARVIGDAAMASGSTGRLQAWWLFRMLTSPDPLGERLTLMWHNHFATSNRKVQNLVWMREQNELFRQHARAPFADLLSAVIKHPAMLVWLDADSNRKGHPNENLARELMELFTLGISNYAEADVKEAARALTGWTVMRSGFRFQDARHDPGEKAVLSHRGNLTGDDLLDLLIEHPSTARRVAWRLCGTFMGEGVVDDDALDRLAKGLGKHRLDIGWAVETILRSELFFSEGNLRARVLGPVEFAVGSLLAFELCEPPPSTLLLSEWTSRMGQNLLYPPNVGGWNEGRAWLGSRTIVARANFAAAIAEGRLWHPSREPDIWELVQRYRPTSDTEEAVSWLMELLWGYVPQSVVDEVLAGASSAGRPSRLRTALALLLARPESQLG